MEYSERLSPLGLTLNEALRGSLPTVDILKQHFTHQLQDCKTLGHRIAKLRHLNAAWRKRAGIDDVSYSELVDPKSDILSALFLDCIDFKLWDMLLTHNRAKQKGDSAEAGMRDLYSNQMLARQPLRSRILDFEEIFAGAPSQLQYEALEAIMYDAECLIRDREDLDRERQVRTSLSGLLAEHKIFKVVRHHETARYATEFEDSFLQWDITIPQHNVDVVNNGKSVSCVAIQVKADSSLERERLKIKHGKSGRIHLMVPMHRSIDQFTLHPGDQVRLQEAVSSAKPVELPWLVARYQQMV